MRRALFIAVFVSISVSALLAEDHRPEHLGPMPDNAAGKAYLALEAEVLKLWKANEKLQTQIDALSPSAETAPAPLQPSPVLKTRSGQPDFPALTKVMEVRYADLQHRHDDLVAKLLVLRSDLPRLPAHPNAQFPWALDPAPTDDLLSLFQGFPKAWTRLDRSPDAGLENHDIDQWVAKNLSPNKTVTFPAVLSHSHAQTVPHPIGIENMPTPPGAKQLAPPRRPDSVWATVASHRSFELQGCTLDVAVHIEENDASKLPQFEPGQPVLITGQITGSHLGSPTPTHPGGPLDAPVLRLDLGMTRCTYTALPLPKPVPMKDAAPSMDLAQLLVTSPDYNAMGDKVSEGEKAQIGQAWVKEHLIGKKIRITIQIGNVDTAKFEPKQVAVMGDTQIQVHKYPSRVVVQALPPDWVTPMGLEVGQTVEVTGRITQAGSDFHLTGGQGITLDECIFKVVKQAIPLPRKTENPYLLKPRRPAN